VRVLVTGARGKVGSATVRALAKAGHEVVASDVMRGEFEAPDPDSPESWYTQADLRDAGEAFATVRGAEAVVHAAAIPEPTKNPAHVVFQNNLMSTFNALEAAIRASSSRSAPRCPTTCRSTSSTRSAPRTHTPPPSPSASS
jgi:nucleoside-diphosphate-sugar epimerase